MRIALEVFAQNGYLGTSMNDNAGQLGFTKAALYKDYSSKQGILDKIVEQMNRMDYECDAEYEMPETEPDGFAEALKLCNKHGKKGICILCAEGRKREFLADPKFLKYKGFKVADISDCGINLMYLPLAENADQPRFKDCARHPKVSETGFVLYYTDQCPFTYYWVPKVLEAAKEHGISFQAFHITDKEAAQNVPAPVTTYALFRDGEFLTQGIQSDKKFLALAGIK